MKAPKIKKVDEDVWSVVWGGSTVEFSYDFRDNEQFVAVYPDPKGCRVKTDVMMTYGKSVVSFAREMPLPKVGDVVEFTKGKGVKPMAEEKKKISKKEGKEAKKKDYYAGKEVKAQ